MCLGCEIAEEAPKSQNKKPEPSQDYNSTVYNS